MSEDAGGGTGPGTCLEAAPAALPESSLRAAPGRGPRLGRILVMDDHRMVLETMRRQLVVFGYEVVVTGNGEEALAAFERARTSGTPFDLVILDRLVEGGWGGERTLEELRRMNPGVKALLWCGSLDAPPEFYLGLGFGAVLRKPYSLADLKLKLEKALLPHGRGTGCPDGPTPGAVGF